MSIRKSKTPLILIFALASQSIHSITFDDFMYQAKETVKGLAVVTGLTVGTYLAGRASSSLHYKFGHERFANQINLLKHKWLLGSDAELYKQLKETILHDHETKYVNSWFCEKDRYRNYPFVKFKDDLDFYIPRLWLLQIFHMGTETQTQIQELIGYLKELRSWIVTDYEFVKERRHYDEKSPASTLNDSKKSSSSKLEIIIKSN